MASVSSNISEVVFIVMNLLSNKAICSFEAVPEPVTLILIFRGAYSKMGISRLQGGCDGDALRPSQFQHGLNVFAEKLGFYSQFIRLITVDDLQGAFEDALQLDVRVVDFIHIQNAGHHQFRFFMPSFRPDNGVAHEIGAGVYAHDEFSMGSDFGEYAAETYIAVGITADNPFFDRGQVSVQKLFFLPFVFKKYLHGVGFSLRLVNGHFGKEKVLAGFLIQDRCHIMLPHERNPFVFNLFVNDKGGIVNDSHVASPYFFSSSL